MKIKTVARISLAATLLLLSADAFADTYMKHIRQTDPFTMMGQSQPGKSETIEIWLGDKAARTDNEDATSTLVVFADEKLFIIKHAERSYVEMPLNIEKIIDKVGPEEQDNQQKDDKTAAMRKMMSAMMQFKVNLQDTGEQQKIGDWQARKYIMTTTTGMGTNTREIWATEDLQADMTAYWQAVNGMRAGQSGYAEMMQEMAKIRGVVVKTVNRTQAMGVEVKSIDKLVEFTTQAAPEGTYTIPAGYSKRELFKQ